jgi:hypothetical protein
MSAQHWALFHDVQKWLTQERLGLGSNKHIELANPRPTLNGITCDLRKVVALDEDVRTLFKRYNPLCGPVNGGYDDAMKGNTFSVALKTDVHLVPDQGGSSSGSGSLSQGLVGRILDEPKGLISLMLLTCICAAFTTSGQSWMNLARALYGLLSLVPFRL